jgi:hypothetical protein
MAAVWIEMSGISRTRTSIRQVPRCGCSTSGCGVALKVQTQAGG